MSPGPHRAPLALPSLQLCVSSSAPWMWFPAMSGGLPMTPHLSAQLCAVPRPLPEKKASSYPPTPGHWCSALTSFAGPHLPAQLLMKCRQKDTRAGLWPWEPCQPRPAHTQVSLSPGEAVGSCLSGSPQGNKRETKPPPVPGQFLARLHRRATPGPAALPFVKIPPPAAGPLLHCAILCWALSNLFPIFT